MRKVLFAIILFGIMNMPDGLKNTSGKFSIGKGGKKQMTKGWQHLTG